MGQVTQVGRSASRALLVTDVQHGLPVLNNRTGQRAIAEGVGRLDRLVIRNLASTSDVASSDLWVTSGLGKRFPAGYPVGTTVETATSADAAYLSVSLAPTAALDVESYVLILTSADAS
jgi:rod shape-determining protein MreC